jgi:hypothetical protein
MNKPIKGFCPTLNREYTITVNYAKVRDNEYIQTGADCEYLSFDFSRCPIYKDCPLRAKAPKEIRRT